MVSMSETGSILPATCTTFASSKQRTTCAMASHSRILARNWLPRPSPFERRPRVRDVDEFDRGGDDFLRLRDGGKLGEARVGHFDDADIGIDGAERIVLGRDPRLGERVE